MKKINRFLILMMCCYSSSAFTMKIDVIDTYTKQAKAALEHYEKLRPTDCFKANLSLLKAKKAYDDAKDWWNAKAEEGYAARSDRSHSSLCRFSMDEITTCKKKVDTLGRMILSYIQKNK